MTEPTDEDLKHARVLWDYHRLDDPLEPSDVIIGLGSHDISVADCAAQLWHDGLATQIVFTGANAPTTVAQFPEGEAVRYRERAIAIGVPESAILIETLATNTAENARFVRGMLAESEETHSSAIIVSRPYQQRRARATFRREWPELKAAYTGIALDFDAYLDSIGDRDRVIAMLVGDTQRIGLYPKMGYAEAEKMEDEVHIAFSHLVQAGYTRRLAGLPAQS